jgi:hypothetical protein
MAGGSAAEATRVSIHGNRWLINGVATHPGTPAEGLLLNVRMVNAIFEDRRHAAFDAEANTDRFIAHAIMRDPKGQAALIRLARETAPGLLVSASGYGDGRLHPEVAQASDFLLPHWNNTPVEQITARIAAVKTFGKPVVANEDDKTGANAVAALRACVENGAGYGLMLNRHNQTLPFHFDGAEDDPVFYAQLRAVTTPWPPAAPPTRALAISRRRNRRAAGARSTSPKTSTVSAARTRRSSARSGSGCGGAMTATSPRW